MRQQRNVDLSGPRRFSCITFSRGVSVPRTTTFAAEIVSGEAASWRRKNMHMRTHWMTRPVGRLSAGLGLLGASLVAAACTAEARPTEEPSADATGTASQALGEAACATVPLSSPHGALLSTSGIVNSPDDQYNPVGCPKQFIVQVTGFTSSESITPSGAGWGDEPLPTNAADCANARAIASWFGWYPGFLSVPEHWDSAPRGQIRYQGSWNSAAGACTLIPVAGYPTGTWPPSGLTKFRVAMQNWQWVNGKPDYKFAGLTRFTMPK